ncbi:CLUMA_CG004822, isoform A [Clunio marinus]|uniref:CLUMA_CG004822, isoform A n=1 Tax=Clunio marinus TaxID=568069 RepID=A0A1J1HX83_9DIPT|nr:CLUMA_CG004822, isoform A [Clunio marinus]
MKRMISTEKEKRSLFHRVVLFFNLETFRMEVKEPSHHTVVGVGDVFHGFPIKFYPFLFSPKQTFAHIIERYG